MTYDFKTHTHYFNPNEYCEVYSCCKCLMRQGTSCLYHIKDEHLKLTPLEVK